MDILPLASEFPTPSREDWLKLVSVVLKGAEFERKLVSRTYDGFEIQPLYEKAEGGKSKLLILLVVLNVLGVSGAGVAIFFALTQTPHAAAEAPVHETNEIGPLIEVPALIVNLTDPGNHFLRAGFNIEVRTPEQQPDVEARMIPIRSAILLHLSHGEDAVEVQRQLVDRTVDDAQPRLVTLREQHAERRDAPPLSRDRQDHEIVGAQAGTDAPALVEAVEQIDVEIRRRRCRTPCFFTRSARDRLEMLARDRPGDERLHARQRLAQ